MQGFEYVCEIFWTISSDRGKKIIYRKHRDDGEKFDNRTKEILVTDWASFARKVLRDNSELKEKIVDYYQRVSSDAENARTEDMRKYEEDVIEQFNNLGERKTLSNAFNNIVVNQKGCRPYFLFGFSATIAVAVGNHSDSNFYIGIEEAKDIFFKAMEVLGYINAECIPDSCFYEDANVRNLLFAALYHSLLVMLPYKEAHRNTNYKTGRSIVEKIMKSDADSKLFNAIKRAAESENIIHVLWETQDELCRVDEIFEGREVPLEDFYSVPSLRGNVNNYKLLNYDVHFRVRSMVEGKEGSGKSCLAKAIILTCRGKITNPALEKAVADEIGLAGKVFIPILLDCSQLDVDEIRAEGIISCALNQMCLKAKQTGDRSKCETLRHFGECKSHIIQYCERKACAEELLLLIDRVSEMEKDCLWELVTNMDNLCAVFPNLHLVFFSNRLKPSEMRMLPKCNVFYIDDFKYVPEPFVPICVGMNVDGMKIEQSLQRDRILRQFIDTPRRFFKYLESIDGKDCFSLISMCIDEEIENKCSCEMSRHMCKEFLTDLALEALDKRKDKSEMIIPEKLLNSNFFCKLDDVVDDPSGIWKLIQKKAILLERSKHINSFQFSNQLYFCSIISDYYIESLEKQECKQCAEILLDGFSKLSSTEFSIIILMIFYRISYGKDSLLHVGVSEENLEFLFKAVAGTLVSYTNNSDMENCLWALERILNDRDWSKEFLKHGRYDNRILMLSKMKRLNKVAVYLHKNPLTLEENIVF